MNQEEEKEPIEPVQNQQIEHKSNRIRKIVLIFFCSLFFLILFIPYPSRQDAVFCMPCLADNDTCSCPKEGDIVWNPPLVYQYIKTIQVGDESSINNTVPLSPTSTIGPDVQDQTSNWKTYTNAFYSYSFRYPKSWFLKPMSEKSIATRDNINSFDMADLEGKVLSFSGENVGLEVGLVDTKRDNETLEDWHVRYESKLGFKDISSITKKKINNIDAIEGIAFPPAKAIIYYIANKESIFIIRINGEKESKSFKTVNQILSTFRFD